MNTQNPAKRRLVVVAPSLSAGGAERMVVNMCRGLDRDRWEITVVTLTGRDDYAAELPGDVRRLSLGKTGPLDIPRVVRRLAHVLSRLRPDVVFTRVYFTALVTFAAAGLARCPAPLVSAIDCHLSLFLRRERLTRLRTCLVRRILPRIDRLVAVSRAVRRDLVDRFGVDPDRCTVIHNSIDTDRVSRLARAELPREVENDDRALVVSAGRLEPEKNFPLLIEAFASAADARQARLVILGEGRERRSLEELVRRLGLEDRVELPGFRANPFPCMQAATVFAFLSNHEGFGNAIVEAMACGAPVVCTDFPAATEIITDGEDGLLVPRGDVKAAADALRRVLADAQLRARLSQAARQRAAAFDNRRVARVYDELFRQVLAEKRP